MEAERRRAGARAEQVWSGLEAGAGSQGGAEGGHVSEWRAPAVRGGELLERLLNMVISGELREGEEAGHSRQKTMEEVWSNLSEE